MDRPTYLFCLLSIGAGLAPSGALGEGPAKTAFEALRTHLIDKHKVKSLGLLDRARDDPATAEAIKSEFAGVIDTVPSVAHKLLASLVETLRTEIDALPGVATTPYAKELRTIRAARNPFAS
jgi:hypothetical protein